jgi:hypothetical protein
MSSSAAPVTRYRFINKGYFIEKKRASYFGKDYPKSVFLFQNMSGRGCLLLKRRKQKVCVKRRVVEKIKILGYTVPNLEGGRFPLQDKS